MTTHKHEELDAWWGSCSLKSILPGLLFSLAATMFVFVMTWLFPRGGLVQIAILVLLGMNWVGLLIFWIYRVFGYNYRLTTCRLFVEIGLRHRLVRSFDLTKVTGVAGKSGPVEKLLGIGRVSVQVRDATPPQVVLRGVVGPEQVAEKIRELCEKARQHGSQS